MWKLHHAHRGEFVRKIWGTSLRRPNPASESRPNTSLFQYCEYYPEYEKCKGWLEKNLPTEFEKMKVQDDSAGGTEDDKKRQKRGGKGNIKTKKNKDEVVKKISVYRAPRSKKKSVTVITGLSTFDVDLKVAAKTFGAKFACGASVTGDDEIVVQGDVKDELFDFIPEKWPEVSSAYVAFVSATCL